MTAGRLLLRAHQVLNAIGLDQPDLEQARSVNNEVWMGDRAVVRLDASGTGRLLREALLADHLPASLGYPPIIRFGSDKARGYLIQRRVSGKPLAHLWPTMGDRTRAEAVAQLCAHMRIIHSTPMPRDIPELNPPRLVASGDDPTAPLVAAIARARWLPTIDRGLLSAVQSFVEDRATALGRFAGEQMVHGDLTFENILWDGRRLRVLDYEFAHGAPPDVDLDVLLRCCALPFLHVHASLVHSANPKDYLPVPGWLHRGYPELFAVDRLGERLLVYAIAFDLRELLAFPPRHNAGELPPFHPIKRLQDTLDGRSYVARFAHSFSHQS